MEFAERQNVCVCIPWLLVDRPKLEVLPTRAEAVRQRKELFRRKQFSDVFVYTDGSCAEKPGSSGLGIKILTPLREIERALKIGIASILTAELCAIHRALELLLCECREFLLPQVTVRLCVDNIAALRLANSVWTSQHNAQLCKAIHNVIEEVSRTGVSLQWHWTPSHAGIHGNECADKLARKAALAVEHLHPDQHGGALPASYPQPKIPISVSNSFLKSALALRHQVMVPELTK